ncbi:MAG: isoprenylcysteine carboxylmethyltransferase family protein [Chloroflexi bacterium]|nr:isoprenylcysteine carboxylmethyltransferase family protein [Chloroflexota bacterium]
MLEQKSTQVRVTDLTQPTAEQVPGQLRDRLGFAFFAFAAILAGIVSWEHPSILGWLNTAHNILVAILYAVRLPAQKSDSVGLYLGLLAALLPVLGMKFPSLAGTRPEAVSLVWTLVGGAGYLLILWSLARLGRRFGIAPADRGLVVSGPYCFVRHPMYTGELLLRLALCAGTSGAPLVISVLLYIQVLRALREERVIAGYEKYANQVRWRLIPFVF